MSSLSSADERPAVIGIVGGVGPFAGLDLQRKILEQTVAARDQDHLPVIAVSWPARIADRTEFLLGQERVNPAQAIVEQLRLLAGAGATLAAIPCNTAHAPAIFDVVVDRLTGRGADFERPPRLLNMIDETAAHLAGRFPSLRTVGVLSTTGTWRTRLYPAALEPRGFRVVVPDETLQLETVHPAIYDPTRGIKATGAPSAWARAGLTRAIAALRDQGAEAIILGCTELPLAFPQRSLDSLPLVDPTLALARALIGAADPERLKPWTEQPEATE